ncbi:MAG: hypothetical protein WEE50_03720 [Chloroflexota bacterium]
MRLRLAILFSLPIAIVFAACEPAAVPSTPATPSPPAASVDVEPSVPDVASTLDPDWITRPALTCGDLERRFPPEALAGIGLAELGLDPAAQVLRTTIAESPPEGALPGTGWQRVIDDPVGVTFVAVGTGDSPWVTVAVGVINGTLQATEVGQCRLQPVAPSGVSFAAWWLDPDQPAPTPESAEVSILVREIACSSGQSPEGRILAPTVVVGAEAIAVAIGIVHRPGGQDCQGNPNHPMRLALPEPLGTRVLLDAGRYPPVPVSNADPRP